ncbi:MAG TPA: CRTAC1 family protein, partial [Thermoanaerobaculia bacterium]|nr:CRTAC1 family protein [Thermoanaerobaculia bacterium]
EKKKAARAVAAASLVALLVFPMPSYPFVESPSSSFSIPPIRFTDVTKRAGLKFKFDTDLRRGRNLATMGGGVAMGDFDGDGFLDLFFTGSAANGKRPEAGPCGVLYRNRGDGTFEDVTARSGIRSCGWTMGASWVDVDGSGRLDLIVTGAGKTSLWKNLGDGTFREEGAARGLAAPGYAVGLAAGDVNGDGRVDLYVVGYLDTDYAKENSFGQFEVRVPEDYSGQEAKLNVQGADGRFVEGAKEAGVLNTDGRGLSAVFFDYDGDGIPDLYVANDRVTNVLYRNKGDGTFDDVTVETGAGKRDQKEARAGMGIAIGDLDGEGRPDILVTNFAGEPKTLYRNLEGALFDDATEASGIERASLPYVQWGTDIVDLDDDGRPDLVMISGHLIPKLIMTIAKLVGRNPNLGPYVRGDRHYKQPPVLYRNAGAGRLEDVTASSGDFAALRVSGRGLAVGDVDGDGRLDVATAAVVGGIHLMKNATASRGHALEILPVAGADRRTVLGTKFIVTAGGARQVQEFILRPSYASGAWVPLHFGLGEATAATIEVVPPGKTEPAARFDGVAADRLYTLRDGRLAEKRAFVGR